MIDELESAATDETLDVSELVDLLVQVRAMKDRLGLIESELVSRLARGRKQGETLDGGRAVVNYGSTKIVWDRDAARRAILSRERELAISNGDWAVDPDTGEKIPTWEAAVQVAEKYWLIGPKGTDRIDPLVTPMREAGIDPDDFRTRTGRTISVRTP